jgi:hypothetical protein
MSDPMPSFDKPTDPAEGLPAEIPAWMLQTPAAQLEAARQTLEDATRRARKTTKVLQVLIVFVVLNLIVQILRLILDVG